VSIHPAPRTGTTPEAEDRSVVHAEAGMKVGQLVAGSVSLVVAGLLLARGFIGFSPGRPLFVVLGVALAASATIGLAIDHVRIRPTRERPEDVFATELARSRRYRHPLALVDIECDAATEEQIIRVLRADDRAWRHHHHLRLLLPETGAPGVAGLAVRLHQELGIANVGAATFPTDALTMEGLERALAPVEPTAAEAPEPAPPLILATDGAGDQPTDIAVGEQ
jgi:hypothetical protein